MSDVPVPFKVSIPFSITYPWSIMSNMGQVGNIAGETLVDQYLQPPADGEGGRGGE